MGGISRSFWELPAEKNLSKDKVVLDHSIEEVWPQHILTHKRIFRYSWKQKSALFISFDQYLLTMSPHQALLTSPSSSSANTCPLPPPHQRLIRRSTHYYTPTASPQEPSDVAAYSVHPIQNFGISIPALAKPTSLDTEPIHRPKIVAGCYLV